MEVYHDLIFSVQFSVAYPRYKWEAVKCYKDNRDIDAVDFADMLRRAYAKSYNLLAAMNYFPLRMIVEFANREPETVRTMFRALFDESKPILDRLDAFGNASDATLQRVRSDSGRSHYQDLHAISVYLAFEYPEKYYIYKRTVFTKFAEKVGYTNIPKRGRNESLEAFKAMCDGVLSFIRQDEELMAMSRARLDANSYDDPEMHMLAMDVVYFGHNYEASSGPWWPTKEEYSPGITKERWSELLRDASVFRSESLAIMKRLKDYGGAATCTQLSKKYGESKNFYNSGSSSLAKRVAQVTGCPVMMRNNESSRWWPVLYVGMPAGNDNDGSYTYKLRDELRAALDEANLEAIPLYSEKAAVESPRGYWWLNANPKIWSLSDIRVGEEQNYTMFNDNGNKRHIFQNFLDAREGDLVIGYESTPVKQVVALCRVSRSNDGQKIFFEKTESLSSPVDYSVLKEIKELQESEYFVSPQGSLFKLTEEEYNIILDEVREANPILKEEKVSPYIKADFLRDVYMDEDRYDSLVALLRRKKNIILQGAPGVGKTYAARRLAYSMMGRQDDSRIEFVQFHQNYSYEDFIMGYKPQGDGFELKYGIFFKFCQRAENNPDDEFFFIIDEINRGNVSKIFGELLMLIENGYRGTKMALAYNGLLFSVPENLYIIGMMNTADRGLTTIDYALRRRFSFFDMPPAFDAPSFKDYQSKLNNAVFDELIGAVKRLNREIAEDAALGEGFRIGHSHFCDCKVCSDEWLRGIIEFDLIPMIREFWFDNPARSEKWTNELREAVND